ncbi:hypothetical protein [Vibrio alfacsensis]|uniref:hypothetical protein n=1 Tax=Vibrio alfacsensis TaxID=1074311 RepID=UPI0040693A6A
MITVHREYSLKNSLDFHASVEVNPVGMLEVDIIELGEHHTTDFGDLSFESRGSETRVCGKEGKVPWQFNLATKDALELSHLVDEANEEYETLMSDLM